MTTKIDSPKRRASSTSSSKQTTLLQAFSNQKRQRTESPMAIDKLKCPAASYTTNTSGNQQVKKIVIKNFAPKGTAEKEAEFYEATFRQLSHALDEIVDNKKIHGLQDLYKGCENMVRGGRNERCARLVRDRLTRHILALKQELEQQHSRGDNVLQPVLTTWATWQKQTITIRSIFAYLDRTFLTTSPDWATILELGTSLFRENLIVNSTLKQPFVNGAVELFAAIRSNQRSASRSQVHDTMELLSSVKLYDSLFEPYFLKATEDFYRHESEAAQPYPISELIDMIYQRLESETELAERYLRPQTKSPVISIVRQELIKANVEHMLTSFDDFAQQADVKRISQLYELLLSVQETASLRTVFAAYIKRAGSTVLADTVNDKTMVESLLALKAAMDELLSKAFQSDDLFSKTLRDEFATFINSRGDVPAEMMAKYIDAVLKSGNKRFNDRELEAQMSSLMDIFRFIASKDVFEAFYKKDLAKRLLLNKSASSDAEVSLLKKLRIECGAQFTSKLEGMFKDIDVSRDYNRTLQDSNLDVMVLSQGSWPTYPDVPVRLPDDMTAILNDYQSHYIKAHKGRNLMWRHTLGQCQIKAHFEQGDKELAVSLFQSVVLLLFNAAEKLTYQQIKAAVGLDEKELTRTLQSLACGKAEHRVLLKSPKGKDVNPTDIFKVNTAFTNSKRIVKINQIQMKETAEEQKATHERVIQDRSFEIQAAIIRIMKSTKRKKHAELVATTIDTIKGRGIPQVSDIKLAIEKLLDKEYISRHDGEYHYEA